MTTENNNSAGGTPFADTSGSGLGWKYDAETKELYLLFEVEGMAHDENGNPTVAGARIRFGPCGNPPTPKQCDEMVATIQEEGIGHGSSGKATPITWEKYVAAGYDDE